MTLQELLEVYGPLHPEVQRLSRELQAAEAALDTRLLDQYTAKERLFGASVENTQAVVSALQGRIDEMGK